MIVLDDYTGTVLDLVDWSPVRATYDVRSVREHLDGESLVAAAADAEVLVAIRERTALGHEVLCRLPSLRLLIATGQNHTLVDLDAAERLGIATERTSGKGESAVPELTIGLMIALARNIVGEHAAMRAGGWQSTLGFRLAGRTLGVVGLGRLGARVAELADAFGMTVVAWSPNLTAEQAAGHGARAVSLEVLLATSDFVTLHVPLTEQSRGLFGPAQLAAMKSSAYLINTSRGPVIDERALIGALRSRGIAGAGLDVYDQEPLPADHPLRTLPNTVLLPHLGYATEEGMRHTFEQVVAIVQRYAEMP